MNDLKPIIDDTEGCRRPIVIAGPCSAESEQQLIDTANGLKAAGVHVFRAGLWKPRTHPGGFEGVGLVGLPWMQHVTKETGMATATEVATRSHTLAAIDAGIKILWIGARTSANPFAMQEIADAISTRNPEELTVLIKNPVNTDLELWIGAIQRIYNAGVKRIGAIHRGFSAYGKHLYRNQPQWQIPFELRRRIPKLTILCDPSHLGGKRELIAPLSQQALDMGFDGLIIESHCNPDCAWSDKEQQITPDVLRVILESLVVRDETQPTESLHQLRRDIDRLDNELMDILARRMAVCREIGRYKKEHSVSVVQTGRYDSMLNTRGAQAAQLGMSQDFIQTVLSAIHEESVRQQIEILDGKNNNDK